MKERWPALSLSNVYKYSYLFTDILNTLLITKNDTLHAKKLHLFTSDNGGSTCFRPHAHVRLSLCLSVCVQDYSKTRAWIWMKCCMSADVGTRMNWLTVELDPDPGTGFLNFSGILTRYGQISMKFYGPLGLDELIRLGFLNFSGISQEVMDIFRWNLMGR